MRGTRIHRQCDCNRNWWLIRVVSQMSVVCHVAVAGHEAIFRWRPRRRSAQIPVQHCCECIRTMCMGDSILTAESESNNAMWIFVNHDLIYFVVLTLLFRILGFPWRQILICCRGSGPHVQYGGNSLPIGSSPISLWTSLAQHLLHTCILFSVSDILWSRSQLSEPSAIVETLDATDLKELLGVWLAAYTTETPGMHWPSLCCSCCSRYGAVRWNKWERDSAGVLEGAQGAS